MIHKIYTSVSWCKEDGFLLSYDSPQVSTNGGLIPIQTFQIRMVCHREFKSSNDSQVSKCVPAYNGNDGSIPGTLN